MSTEDDVRRIATALPEVDERSSYGTPAFYVAGKIFARLHERPGMLVCWRANLGERELLLAADPDKFFTTDHYTGHASVLVRLEHVDAEELTELLAEAWDARAPRRLKNE
ncbi:MAG TPA: MmcQ/YjbR family DNA-binding protein [Candidatus Corynebacterium avicola]|uniref:MmcQ/YjbR family DNA-binding protein n=1 Tax=Candidatus Corynebacterium avicola TaxID=2838527 RepID=A0A9D1RME6_9CORY|nr:MmcQ/YjbR family DNA-binding protein [Candidatus Corynebacterium avicola]